MELLHFDDCILEFWATNKEKQITKALGGLVGSDGEKQLNNAIRKDRAKKIGIGAAIVAGAGALGYGAHKLFHKSKSDKIASLNDEILELKGKLKNATAEQKKIYNKRITRKREEIADLKNSD